MNTVIRTGWWQGLQQLNYTVCVLQGAWQSSQPRQMDMRTENDAHTYARASTHSTVCTEAQVQIWQGSNRRRFSHDDWWIKALWLCMTWGVWLYLRGDPAVHDPLCVPVPLAFPSYHAGQVHPKTRRGQGKQADVMRLLHLYLQLAPARVLRLTPLALWTLTLLTPPLLVIVICCSTSESLISALSKLVADDTCTDI